MEHVPALVQIDDRRPIGLCSRPRHRAAGAAAEDAGATGRNSAAGRGAGRACGTRSRRSKRICPLWSDHGHDLIERLAQVRLLRDQRLETGKLVLRRLRSAWAARAARAAEHAVEAHSAKRFRILGKLAQLSFGSARDVQTCGNAWPAV
jgi:hypothetical protein